MDGVIGAECYFFWVRVLNKLVIFRIMGLWNVKVVHIFGFLGYSLVMFDFDNLC
jgi:hypothetical protein